MSRTNVESTIDYGTPYSLTKIQRNWIGKSGDLPEPNEESRISKYFLFLTKLDLTLPKPLRVAGDFVQKGRNFSSGSQITI